MNRRLLTAIGAAILLISAMMPATAVAKVAATAAWSGSTARPSARWTPTSSSRCSAGEAQATVMSNWRRSRSALRAADAQAAGAALTKADKPAIRREVKRSQDALKAEIASAGARFQRQYQDAYNGMQACASRCGTGAQAGHAAWRRRDPTDPRVTTQDPDHRGAVHRRPGRLGRLRRTPARASRSRSSTRASTTRTPTSAARERPPPSTRTTRRSSSRARSRRPRSPAGTDFVGDDYDPESTDPNLFIAAPRPRPDRLHHGRARDARRRASRPDTA